MSSDELELEENAEDGELILEENDDSDSDGSLALEDNDGGSDDGESDTLLLEDNDADSDCDGLQLEENEEEDGDDELALEDNDEGGSDDLELEMNDGGIGEEDEVEEVDTDILYKSNTARASANGVAAYGAPAYGAYGAGSYGEQLPPSGVYGQDGFAQGGFGAMPTGTGDAGADGLNDALRALDASGAGTGLGRGENGEVVDPQKFLIPEAKAQLEQGLALNPLRPGETESQRQCRVLQQLTANCGEWTFTDAARQICEAYGTRSIAERMRLIGDDHFAAGCYTQAKHAYTAGLAKAEASGGNDASQVMHCHVNRASAYLKLGQTEEAIADANVALALAEQAGAGKAQKRKALLRRAQAFFEAGDVAAAKGDLAQLPSDDPGAERLMARVRGEDPDAGGVQV